MVRVLEICYNEATETGFDRPSLVTGKPDVVKCMKLSLLNNDITAQNILDTAQQLISLLKLNER